MWIIMRNNSCLISQSQRYRRKGKGCPCADADDLMSAHHYSMHCGKKKHGANVIVLSNRASFERWDQTMNFTTFV